MARLVIVFVLLSRRACFRRRGANGIRGSILSAPPLSPAFGVLIIDYCGLLFATTATPVPCPSSRLVCVGVWVCLTVPVAFPGGTSRRQTPSNMSESAVSPEAPLEPAPLNLDVSFSIVAHSVLLHCGCRLRQANFVVVYYDERMRTPGSTPSSKSTIL